MAKQTKSSKSTTTRTSKKGTRTSSDETQRATPQAAPKTGTTTKSGGGSATAVAEPGTATTAMVASDPTIEQIQARAYEIYVARGGRPGSPEADWLQAERELRSGD